jgi:hypothetical protein
MTLLEFAQETQKLLDASAPKEFAKLFVSKKSEYFNKFAGGKVMSSSHGIDFFKNVIKFWDDPRSYYGKAKPKDPKQDYEYQFVMLLEENKN